MQFNNSGYDYPIFRIERAYERLPEFADQSKVFVP